MDRSIEPNFEEKIKARKAIVPFLYDMFKGLDKVEINNNSKTINSINIPEIKKALTDAVSLIKFPSIQKVKGEVEITNQKEIQKVEVTNQQPYPKYPEIKIEEKVITFPELQKIIGEVKATNLPIGTEKEANTKNANPSNYLIVRLSDGQKFIDGIGGATSAPMGRSTENIYLREEYSYTTVSGSQVPTMVKKWTDNMVLTETYEYDANANPIKKFRSIEPYNA
jgi:hypothetical protein